MSGLNVSCKYIRFDSLEHSSLKSQGTLFSVITKAYLFIFCRKLSVSCFLELSIQPRNTLTVLIVGDHAELKRLSNAYYALYHPFLRTDFKAKQVFNCSNFGCKAANVSSYKRKALSLETKFDILQDIQNGCNRKVWNSSEYIYWNFETSGFDP